MQVARSENGQEGRPEFIFANFRHGKTVKHDLIARLSIVSIVERISQRVAGEFMGTNKSDLNIQILARRRITYAVCAFVDYLGHFPRACELRTNGILFAGGKNQKAGNSYEQTSFHNTQDVKLRKFGAFGIRIAWLGIFSDKEDGLIRIDVAHYFSGAKIEAGR